MNIFVSDKCPIKSAQALDDRRLVKMVLETAQLLSTAVYHLGYWHHGLYKPTHSNHPCSLWARASKANFEWLGMHAIALANEYKFRYNLMFEEHKSKAIIEECISIFRDKQPNIPEDITPFTNATPLKDNDGLSVVDKYKKYLKEVKWVDGKSRWTKRQPPDWR